jgi:hypothetical protein
MADHPLGFTDGVVPATGDSKVLGELARR